VCGLVHFGPCYTLQTIYNMFIYVNKLIKFVCSIFCLWVDMLLFDFIKTYTCITLYIIMDICFYELNLCR
jgi:hypothetical protein